MTAVELYRHEKARHFAKLESIFAEIRPRLEASCQPSAFSQRIIASNKARAKHPDRETANATYYSRHRAEILRKQKARRSA